MQLGLGLLLGVAALSAIVASGCSSPQTSERAPEPSLASTREAQQDFRSLKQALQESGAPATKLAAKLKRFIAQHPDDGRTPLVRVHLALVLVEAGELDDARRALAPLEQQAGGTTRDFSQLARAALMLAEKQPGQARKLLEPLRGKLIDSEERLLYGELLVKSALHENRIPEAVLDMRWWLQEVEATDVPEVQGKVAGLITRFDQGELEQAGAWLAQTGKRADTHEVFAWLEQQVTAELARKALRDEDTELAQRLVRSMKGSAANEKTLRDLTKLAQKGELRRIVVGRTLGLVLSLKTSEARNRSSQVSAGIMRALGLPRAPSDPGSVRLLVKDDAEGMRGALASLAGSGASILIAGVDTSGADEATEFAEQAAIPTLVLAETSEASAPLSYAFSLAASEQAQKQALLSGLKARGRSTLVLVGGKADTDVSCGGQSPAGQSRFALAEWQQRGVDGIVLLSDKRCGSALLQELAASRQKPLVGLGLELAPLALQGRRGQLLYLRAGAFPNSQQAESDAPRHWFEALGRDAARLGAAALEHLPSETADDARVVAELHNRARDALLTERVELYTTNTSGFDDQHRLARTLEPTLEKK